MKVLVPAVAKSCTIADALAVSVDVPLIEFRFTDHKADAPVSAINAPVPPAVVSSASITGVTAETI